MKAAPKVAPYAVLSAALLTGWVSAPATASETRDSAEPAPCAVTFLKKASQVRLMKPASSLPHAHGSSCTCAACMVNSALAE